MPNEKIYQPLTGQERYDLYTRLSARVEACAKRLHPHHADSQTRISLSPRELEHLADLLFEEHQRS